MVTFIPSGLLFDARLIYLIRTVYVPGVAEKFNLIVLEVNKVSSIEVLEASLFPLIYASNIPGAVIRILVFAYLSAFNRKDSK